MPPEDHPDRDPELPKRVYDSEKLIQDWRIIGNLWLHPDPAMRDDDHLRQMEVEMADDLERVAALGRFNEEEKDALRQIFGPEGRQASEPDVAERIRKVIESL